MNSKFLLLADNVIHTSDKDLGGETIAAVVITGIAVVFIGLIILILLVWLYGKIFEKINAGAENKKAAESDAKTVVKQETVSEPQAPTVESGIDEEITAVIAAAIAAYGVKTGKRLAVRSIKTAGHTGGRNAWSAAGLSEATRPF